MWIWYLVVIAAVVAVVGSIALGGIFTIIFVPLILIGLVTMFATGALGRIMQRPGEAFPKAGAGGPATAGEDLVDARRVQQ